MLKPAFIRVHNMCRASRGFCFVELAYAKTTLCFVVSSYTTGNQVVLYQMLDEARGFLVIIHSQIPYYHFGYINNIIY